MNAAVVSTFARTAARLGLIMFVAYGLIGVSMAQAQDARPVDRALKANGTLIFRGVLAAAGVESVENPYSLAYEDLSNLIIIFHGRPDQPTSLSRIGFEDLSARTLKAGGAVLFLMEQPGSLDAYFPEPTGITITDGKVFSTRPDDCLDGYLGCPYPVPKPTTLDSLGEVLTAVPGTATNHPTALTLTNPSRFVREIVADFPRACRLGNTETRLAKNQGFMAAGAGRDGEPPFRCLVISDKSVVMNQMLAMSDPSGGGPRNLAFAYQVVKWLQGPGPDVRTRCLFLDEGMPRSRIDPLSAVPPLPIPPLPDPLDPAVQARLTDAGNAALANLADEDTFNRRIVGEPEDRQRFAGVLRALAIAAMIVVFVVAVYRGWASRHPESRSPGVRPTTEVESPTEVLRELFAGQGITLPEKRIELPPIEVSGPKSRMLRKNIRTLWDAMFGRVARSVARPKDMQTMIVDVWTAAQDGHWRFTPTERPTPPTTGASK